MRRAWRSATMNRAVVEELAADFSCGGTAAEVGSTFWAVLSLCLPLMTKLPVRARGTG